jgi:flavin-dependent dehydrogenase
MASMIVVIEKVAASYMVPGVDPMTDSDSTDSNIARPLQVGSVSVHPAAADTGDGTLHVVGAGPAGLAAAITAAKSGRHVVVHEVKDAVGSRFHGDFQGLDNWTVEHDVLDELREAGIESTFDYYPCRVLCLCDSRGREHAYHSEEPFYYLIRRGQVPRSLDCSLAEQARAAGVELRFGNRVSDLFEGIVAHGPRAADIVAVGYIFETDTEDTAVGVLDDRLAPGGYSYLLIRDGIGTVATTMFRDFREQTACLQQTVEFFSRKYGLRMQDPRPFTGYGNARFPSAARKGRVLHVGEAAGFQDALWGFGLRYAMLSGHFAARAFVEGAPESFDHLWRERLGGYLETGVLNRFLYGHGRELAYRYMFHCLDRAEDPCDRLRRMFAPSPVKRLAFRMMNTPRPLRGVPGTHPSMVP